MIDARKKFWDQRGMAKHRGIPFLFTFEEWYDIWQKSGHWEDRGVGRGKYCMSRVGDNGAYEVGNVFIQTHTQTVIDATKGKHHSLSKQTKEKMRVSAFKYWERKKAAINQSA